MTGRAIMAPTADLSPETRPAASSTAPSALDEVLIGAYRAAHYCVTGVADPFLLRVDAQSTDLARCHSDHGVSRSAFLTAYNPRSQRVPDEDNERAHAHLERVLRDLGYVCLDALGVDPSGEWPAEPSLLVLGAGLEDARSLGVRFGQNGLLWSDTDATPRLVLLR